MKFFEIHKKNLLPVALFSALFALLEGSAALSLSAGEAMFIGGVGVEGLPAAYIMLFLVMTVAIAVLSLAQSRIELGKVFKAFLLISAVCVALLAAGFSIFDRDGDVAEILFYILKLSSAVWMYAGFSLYWNFVDEHFNIRQGKRVYAILAAFGCAGGVLGAGIVFVFSEYFKTDAAVLLWVWLVCVLAAIPLVGRISEVCRSLDSSVDFDSSSIGALKMFSSNLRDMLKSPYVRAIFLMYLAVIVAATINEYAWFSVFSEHAENDAISKGYLGAELQAATTTALASLFGMLAIGVNVFNLFVNLFFFNKLVGRFGVGNIALLQSALLMIAFVWLLNSFGMAAAVFSLFVCRGFLESMDANNENLMVSILPASIRGNVRLMIESMIVPFATALAGVFLMFYPKAETSNSLALSMPEISEALGFGTLSMSGIMTVGFFVAFVGFIFAVVCRSEYPKVLAKNLRAGWLNFYRNFSEVCADAKFDTKSLASLENQISVSDELSISEIEAVIAPEKAAKRIFKNAEKFSKPQLEKAAKVLNQIFESKDFSAHSAAADWLLNSKIAVPELALAAASSGVFAASVALSRFDIDAEVRKKILEIFPKDFSKILEDIKLSEFFVKSDSEKISILNFFSRHPSRHGVEFALENLDSENLDLRGSALRALAECCDDKTPIVAEYAAPFFKSSNEVSRDEIIKIISKSKAAECFESALYGVSRISVSSRRKILEAISQTGRICAPSLVKILKNGDYSYASKSICAQALAKVFPAQLETLGLEIAKTELERAYYFVVAECSAEEFGSRFLVLKNIFLQRQREIIDFVILIFSLLGKLPPHEVLSGSLLSGSEKETGNAIESLEQGMPREYFELALPLVDGRKLSKKIEFAHRRLKIKTPSLEEVISSALKSAFDEEFLAACAILAETDFEKLAPILCEKINLEKTGTLRSELIELLDGIAFANFSGNTEISLYPHPQKFADINACDYFEGFEIQAMAELLPKAEICDESDNEFAADSLLIYRNADSKVTWFEIEKGGKFNPQGKRALYIKISDIFEVASGFPEAAAALYMREEARA